MKKIALSFLSFIIMPISLFLVWHFTNLVFDFEASAIPPSAELGIAVLEGFLSPVLVLIIIFKITQKNSNFYKPIRICGIIGCIVTILSVFVLLPWIKFGIAFRGVKM